MAEIGGASKSFLRSSIISTSEPNFDNKFFSKLLVKNEYGFVRKKQDILSIARDNGIRYRMVFNAMNMRDFTRDEIQEHIDTLSIELEDRGVAGIVEFHNADGTQNSDHIHLWINTEEKFITSFVANYLVHEGLSNREDVYIQKFNENGKIDDEFLFQNNIVKEKEENYANEEQREILDEQFLKLEEYKEKKKLKSKERKDGNIQIRSIPLVRERERENEATHQHMLSFLPDRGVADKGRREFTDNFLLLPFDEEGEFYDGQNRDTSLRLQKNIGNELDRAKQKIKQLTKNIEVKIKKYLEGSNMLNEKNTDNALSIVDKLEEANKKTVLLYKELYGIEASKAIFSETDAIEDENYEIIKELRNSQTNIMRQL